ncbi:protein H2A.5-like [Papaver somniferum]|uniref:protein H2A.5-like n=1 Tax=Papaver somniferum TaxID=3469 RepID=UPI000E6F6DA5|nr:protein H2A.5-like [Papaver somniferum]
MNKLLKGRVFFSQKSADLPYKLKVCKGGRKGGDRRKAVAKSVKVGLRFPVGTMACLVERVGSGAPVYLAAFLEYLVLLTFWNKLGNAAKDNKKSRIIPRHLLLPMMNDQELLVFHYC